MRLTERWRVMSHVLRLAVLSAILLSHTGGSTAQQDCVPVTPPVKTLVYGNTLELPAYSIRCDCCATDPTKDRRWYMTYMANVPEGTKKAGNEEGFLKAGKNEFPLIPMSLLGEDCVYDVPRVVEEMTCAQDAIDVQLFPAYYYELFTYNKGTGYTVIKNELTNILPLLSPDGQLTEFSDGYATVDVGRIDFGTFPDLTNTELKCTVGGAVGVTAVFNLTNIENSMWGQDGIIASKGFCRKYGVLCKDRTIEPLKTARIQVKISFDEFMTDGGILKTVKCEFADLKKRWDSRGVWNLDGLDQFVNEVSYESPIVVYKPSVFAKVDSNGTTSCEIYTFAGDVLVNVTIEDVSFTKENATFDKFKYTFVTTTSTQTPRCTACGKQGCTTFIVPTTTSSSSSESTTGADIIPETNQSEATDKPVEMWLIFVIIGAVVLIIVVIVVIVIIKRKPCGSGGDVERKDVKYHATAGYSDKKMIDVDKIIENPVYASTNIPPRSNDRGAASKPLVAPRPVPPGRINSIKVNEATQV